jgi:DNA mismatch repair protein MutL
MRNKPKLHRLSEEVINQIAAGEVIERPSSVVKELVDNSIDAQAEHIVVKVREGGISLIEVSDDGIGIPKEDLSEVFTAHTTSKLENIDDLNTVLSMGFRGEALSTIVAVSNTSMISKYADDDFGNEIVFTNSSDFKIKKATRENGTVVKVENIFDKIPVRKKYLKTAQTEYRNILNILTPYFLIYPNIHWELYKDGKEVVDLHSIEKTAGTIDKERVKEVIKQDFVERMETVFLDGNGMKISGLIAHPSDHMSRTKYQYVFVNGRNVWDNSVARAVIQAYDRYVPHGEKVPFIINIKIKPELVDINVHPRKEEVKFLNPYRVYSSVEQAVKNSIDKLVSYKNIPEKDSFEGVENIYNKQKAYSSHSRNINFSQGSTVRDSLSFSKAALENSSQNTFFKQIQSEEAIEENFKKQSKKEIQAFHQIFNKYVIVEFEDAIWIIDQHAAAERITFEKLSKVIEIKNTDTQNLLVEEKIKLDNAEIEFIKENKQLFINLGFNIEIKDKNLVVKSIPVEFVDANIVKLIKEVLEIDVEEVKDDLDRLKKDLVATMACHTSIRSGQKLDVSLMKNLYYNLLDCDNPYSCPHGRPIVWKMSIEQIDSNFDRTY